MGEKKRKMVLDLPIPMPTWNRLLAMGYHQRKNIRHMIHGYVLDSINQSGSVSPITVSDSATQTDSQLRQLLTVLSSERYLQMTRPSKSRKLHIVKLRAEKRELSLKLKRSEKPD